MFHKIVKAMEIPEELTDQSSIIEIQGTHKVHIENYVRIIEYSQCQLILQCKGYRLAISGNSFTLTVFTKTELILYGNICQIDFWQ